LKSRREAQVETGESWPFSARSRPCNPPMAELASLLARAYLRLLAMPPQATETTHILTARDSQPGVRIGVDVAADSMDQLDRGVRP
jgi:hypothetical protein